MTGPVYRQVRLSCCTAFLPTFLALAASVVVAQSPIMVDFSQAPDEQPLQDSWLPFVGDDIDPVTETFELNGDSVDVTVEGNTHWRDYREATGGFAELSDLLRDGPLCNDVCSMILSLEGLSDGAYEFRPYFHTTQFGDQDGRSFTPFEIYLTDGAVSDQRIVDDKLMSDDSSDELSHETIPFQVVGGSTAQVFIEKLGGDDHLAIAGFELGTAGSLGDPLEKGEDTGGGDPIVIEPDGLMIDFSREPDGEPLQDGWESFVGEGTDVFTETFDFEGTPVDVTIEGNTHWRDYRAATGIYQDVSDVVSDGPLCNDACLMTLRLEGLQDGSYELTTFLHTTQFGDQDGRPFTPFEMRLTDGNVSDQVIVEEKLMSDDSSEELSTETISLNVVGGSPVEIVLEKPGGDDHMALPGIQLVPASGAPRLLPGDSDQDWDFDQLDLVKVQIAAKYLTGEPATWGEGDWDGAPGGTQGAPPAGDGRFDQLDIIKALSVGIYLTGPYAAIGQGGADPGTVDLVGVPEPGTVVLLGVGLVLIIGAAGRRRW